MNPSTSQLTLVSSSDITSKPHFTRSSQKELIFSSKNIWNSSVIQSSDGQPLYEITTKVTGTGVRTTVIYVRSGCELAVVKRFDFLPDTVSFGGTMNQTKRKIKKWLRFDSSTSMTLAPVPSKIVSTISDGELHDSQWRLEMQGIDETLLLYNPTTNNTLAQIRRGISTGAMPGTITLHVAENESQMGVILASFLITETFLRVSEQSRFGAVISGSLGSMGSCTVVPVHRS